MKMIAHRGNINGSSRHENDPAYIVDAISSGFDAEIDVWYDNCSIYLGHDQPDYKVNESFLIDNSSFLWCHAKTSRAFDFLLGLNVNCFWHQNDDYTLTSKGYVWMYPKVKLVRNSIWNQPELNELKINVLPKDVIANCHGICSDSISLIKDIFQNTIKV